MKPASRPARRMTGVKALAAFLLLAILAGCAYYNTFFHAKKDYAKALRIEVESKTDRLSPEAVKCYDQAIERCNKVILEYEGGWRAGIDDALFLMGQCYYGKREYETAIDKFDALLLNYPQSDHAAEAQFYSGLCYHRLRNFGTADQIFEELLAAHPRFGRRDEIYYIMAEGLESAGERGAAVGQYARILRDFPRSKQKEKALQRVSEIHFDEGRFDSALVAYADLARTTQDDQAYIEAQFRRGACLVRLGRGEEALAIYQLLLPENPEKDDLGARTWLAMADAYNRLGRHDEALEKLALVIENFENRQQSIEASYSMGYAYEVYLHNYDEAEKAYQKACQDQGRSVFRDQAARRLENLRNMKELATEGAAGDSSRDARAVAALKVAEFSLLESRDSTTALAQYAGVQRDFPGTDAALRAAYARGWILSREPDSSACAMDVLGQLIESNPGCHQAEGALMLVTSLGAPDERRSAWESLVAKAKAVTRAREDSVAAVEKARADSLQAAETARADSLNALMRQKALADSLAASRGVAADSSLLVGRASVPGDSTGAAQRQAPPKGRFRDPGRERRPEREPQAAADSSVASPGLPGGAPRDTVRAVAGRGFAPVDTVRATAVEAVSAQADSVESTATSADSTVAVPPFPSASPDSLEAGGESAP